MVAVHVKGHVDRKPNICEICNVDMKKNPKRHRESEPHKEAVARKEGARKEVDNLSLPSTSKLELRRIKNKIRTDEAQWSKVIDYYQVKVGFTS